MGVGGSYQFMPVQPTVVLLPQVQDAIKSSMYIYLSLWYSFIIKVDGTVAQIRASAIRNAKGGIKFCIITPCRSCPGLLSGCHELIKSRRFFIP